MQHFGNLLLYPGGPVAEVSSAATLSVLLLVAASVVARLDLGPLVRAIGRARKRSGARPSPGGDS